MTEETVNSTHVHEGSGTVKDGARTEGDPGISSNGTQVKISNASMTIAPRSWYLTDGDISKPLPAAIVKGLLDIAGSDTQVGMSMAIDLFGTAWSMAQNYRSNVSIDQFQRVVNDMVKQTHVLSEESLLAQSDAHSKGNQQFADALKEALSQLDDAMKAATNPNNTESLPFVTAEVMVGKLTEAFTNFEKMRKQEEGNMNETLIESLNSYNQSFSNFEAVYKSESEAREKALWEALGLKQQLDEAEDKTATKGAKFEDDVSEQLTALAGHFGDKLEDVGNQTDGIGNSKVGDHIATIMHGKKLVGKIVFEDKSGSVLIGGASGLVSQLNQAITNYGADAGIGIVNSKRAPARLKKAGYLRTSSNTHLVCVDWDEGDFSVLDILYPIVRELVTIQSINSAGEDSSVDSNAVIEICEEALSDLKEFNKLKLNLRNTVASGALNTATALEVAQNKLQATFLRLISLHREDPE